MLFRSTQTVTITVEGRNDNPVITTDSGPDVAQTLHEAAETSATPQDNAGDLTASGNLAFFDADATDTFTARVLGVVVTGTTGTEAPNDAAFLAMLTTPTDAASGTTVTEAGGIPWSFTGGEDKFDYLAAGESVVLTYTIEVKDNSGGTDTQTVTITVEGRNDAPVNTVPDTQSSEVGANLVDRKSTRLNSSHIQKSRMPSSA